MSDIPTPKTDAAASHRERRDMIELDPVLVLKNPWLWDAKTIAWAQAIVDARNTRSDANG